MRRSTDSAVLIHLQSEQSICRNNARREGHTSVQSSASSGHKKRTAAGDRSATFCRHPVMFVAMACKSCGGPGGRAINHGEE